MNASQRIALLIRERTPAQSNYAAAKALGVSPSNYKEILDGKRNLGVEAIFRAAELLDRDVKEVLVEIQHDTAKTPEKKAFWEKKRPRILPAVVIWGIAAGVIPVTKSDAAVVRNGLATISHAIHYAQVVLLMLTVAGRTACGLVRCAHKIVYKGSMGRGCGSSMPRSCPLRLSLAPL